MNRFFWLIPVLLCCFSVNTQAQLLSNDAKVSLLTADPGKDVYSTFGHSAIRIYDPASRVNAVFNYGVFDFDTPNFYTKFIRGKLLYKLGLQSYTNYLNDYKRGNRKVIEQPLNLDSAQVQELYALLKKNYQPENRYYLYDFFFDNCATRIRDIMETTLPDQIQYPEPEEEVRFRQLLDEYLHPLPWTDFGVDLILGLPADQIAGLREQMFLPDYLSENLGKAQLASNNETIPLMQSGTILFDPPNPARPNAGPITPSVLFWVFALVIALLTWRMGGPKMRWFDGIWFTLLGFAGCFFLFMWLGTDHLATKNNLNVLWAFPLWLLFGPLLFRRSPKTWVLKFLGAYSVLLLLLLITWPWFPQDFHDALIPLLLVTIIRGVSRFYSA
jgi:hypothetical protein